MLVFRTDLDAFAPEAYSNLTKLLGLQRELDRNILIQDISASDRSQSSELALMYLT